jgi:hypothetical protein
MALNMRSLDDALKHTALRMHKCFDPYHLLIEDAGTGTFLMQS